MVSRLPFSGFYESMWSSQVDHCEEMEIERLCEEHELSHDEVWNVLDRHAKWHEAYEKIAEEYPKYFGELLGIEIKFDGMESPKYYNFETDRIFGKISVEDLYKLYRKVGKKRMRKAAEKMFRSRDGFISHYSWDLDDWGRIPAWDHNQDYCLLCAYVEMEFGDDWEWSLVEDMNDVILNACSNCVDWEAVNFDIGKLLGAKEKEEELTEEEGERHFPNHWKNAADYIKKFIELNGYKHENHQGIS